MRSIATATEEIIHDSPFIEDMLVKDILNVSGYAREIKMEVEEKTQKPTTVGAIVMALQRYKREIEKSSHPYSLGLQTIFPEVFVRSNLFEITFENSPTLIEKQKKLLEQTQQRQNTFATVTHGVFETTIIGSEQIKEYVLSLYAREQITSQINELSSITIKFPKNIIDLPGVYYMVLKVLAFANITLTEVVSTYSEFTLVLEQVDVDRAFTIIKNLFLTHKKKDKKHR